MCALLFCRNVRFSKQRGGERTLRRAWTCLHVWCVKLTNPRMYSKMSTSTLWKGQISCWVKTGRSSCHFLPIYNSSSPITTNTLSSVWGDPEARFCSIFRKPYKQNHRKWETWLGAQRRGDNKKTWPQQTVVCRLWINVCNQSIHKHKHKHAGSHTGFELCYTSSAHTVIWFCMVSLVIYPFYVCSLREHNI